MHSLSAAEGAMLLGKLEAQNKMLRKVTKIMSCSKAQAFISIALTDPSPELDRKVLFRKAYAFWKQFESDNSYMPDFVENMCIDICRGVTQPPKLAEEVARGIFPPKDWEEFL